MPAGRPSNYSKDFCDKVIQMGKEGMSKAEMAMELGIARGSFDNYEKQFPEFLDAVKEAVGYSQAWWERTGRKATNGEITGFNATAWIFNMKNRFKEDWRDKVEQELTGKDGGPIQQEHSLSTSDAQILSRFIENKGKS